MQFTEIHLGHGGVLMRKATLAMVLLAAVAVVAFPGSAAAQSSDVTFHKDIEPILQRSCQVCHRPDNMAPMSLMNLSLIHI